MGFFENDFHYENEKSILVLAFVLFAAGTGIAYRIYKHEKSIFACATALVLMQLAGTVSAGYRDGKAVFNGSANVFFLDNKEICEQNEVRDWIYLGKFSTKSFFLNTIDKRLCITDVGSYKLSSRKFTEGLWV